VRSFDSDGLPGGWSDPGLFELGLLEPDAWRAHWIGTPLSGSPATPVGVPVLRRSFELPDDCAAARLHVTALGVYRVELNGQPVADDQLTPGWTDYRQRVRYQTYDVTALLQAGGNGIGVLLGDGWYCGNPGIGNRQQYGDHPLLFAQINVTLASGATLVVCTDHQWKWQRSWLLYSDLVLGESVDGRQYRSGWSEFDCDETGWYPVVVAPAPAVKLDATASVPMAAHAELQPVADPLARHRALEPPCRLYDFGRHLVGRARIRLVADPGIQLRVRYANALDPGGELAALDRGTDWYTTAGTENGERFEAQFSLHGFRYVELCGDLAACEQLTVTAVPVRSRLSTTVTFNSDHPALNALFDAMQDSYGARALDIPVAGPGSTRRMGLTGTARGLLGGMAFGLDVAAFYAKWLDDLADAQLADGGFPAVVPVPPGMAELHLDVGVEGAGTFVLGAWLEYRQFGNRRVLERHYPALCACLRSLNSRWPEHVCEPGRDPLVSDAAVPADLRATASYFHTARLAARIAGVLGKLSDLEEFEELAQSVRSAFRRRFVSRDGRLVGDTDAAYVLALHLGLLDRAEQRAAVETLVRRIEHGGPQAMDPLTVPELLQVLSRAGRVDLVYQMLLQPGSDGWLERSLRNPAGLWSDVGADLARMAVASIGDWLVTGLAGLDLDSDLSESHNAFRRVRIQPRPPLGAGVAVNAFGPPLRMVEVTLDTVNGRYECGWEITDSAFELRVLVPCNCSALVLMPDGTEHVIAAGRHELRMPLIDASDGIPILREVSQSG